MKSGGRRSFGSLGDLTAVQAAGMKSGAAKVLGKSYDVALAEMKSSPAELWPRNREPLTPVGAYAEYETATLCMS